MDGLVLSSAQVLTEAGFTVAESSVHGRPGLVFESGNVLGFLIAYDSAHDLIALWETDLAKLSSDFQLALRRSGQKAWNTYAVFLAQGALDHSERVTFSVIEEDLRGTRKIAHGDIASVAHIRDALLPLLPLHSAPILTEVDIAAEIRLRATELDERVLEAYLSDATEQVVLQALEEFA